MSTAQVHRPTLDDVFLTLTGRSLPQFIVSPKPLTALVGHLADLVQRFVSIRLPISHQQAMGTYCGQPADNSLAEQLAGAAPPVEQTLADAILWLVSAGHLPAAWAGKLAEAPRLAA